MLLLGTDTVCMCYMLDVNWWSNIVCIQSVYTVLWIINNLKDSKWPRNMNLSDVFTCGLFENLCRHAKCQWDTEVFMICEAPYIFTLAVSIFWDVLNIFLPNI